MEENPAGLEGAVGASLYVPFTLAPGETRNIRLYMAWHVPLFTRTNRWNPTYRY